jgi:molybdopterin-containing oxidoreductase family membrane subunit
MASAAVAAAARANEQTLVRPVSTFRPKLFVGSLLTGLLVGLLFWSWGYQIVNDIGVAGINRPVFWGFYIVNFVFWIGISHAGTLISAILRVTQAEWRRPVTRCAEAITTFALLIGGLFPLIHLGRPWIFWYMMPIPTDRGLWPNFRSPLMWDVFAVSTYATVSVLFWYVGMIPDLATLRDRAKSKAKQIFYGIFSMGWRGSNRHWSNYEMMYLLLAALSTPLVLSVHTIVSFDFAVALLPGWPTIITL